MAWSKGNEFIDIFLYSPIEGYNQNFKENFEQYTIDGLKLTTLSVRPLVLSVDDFLTNRECDLIKNLSEPHMFASQTSKMDHDEDKADTEWRTSTQYWLSPSMDPTIALIDKKVAFLTRSSMVQQEHVQVLRYLIAQKYDTHHDYFDPKFYQNDREFYNSLNGGETNRLITVFWYLSTVEKGGHTIFPKANGNKYPVILCIILFL